MAEYSTTSDDLKGLLEADRKITDVLNLKDNYEQSTQTQRADWKKALDSYQGVFTGPKLPYQSQYFVPKISTAVSVMVPIVIGNFPSFRVVPIGKEDESPASAMEEILKFQADYEIDLYSNVVQWVTQAAAIGTSYMYVPWVVRKDDNGKKIYDGVELEVPSTFDIFVNPTIPSVADLEKRNMPIIHRFWSTVEDIESNPLYRDKLTVNVLKDLKETVPSPENNYGSSDIINSTRFAEDAYLKDVKKVVVYYCWTKDKLRVVAKGKDKHLLYEGKNPWGLLPFADFKWEVDAVPGLANGRGIGQQGIDIQDMYNKLFNQLVDNVRNAANKMYQRRRGSRIDPRQFITRPAGFIDVNEIDKDIKELETKSDVEALIRLLAMVDQQFQIATANTDVVQGIAGADSASEAIILNRNTALRIELIRKNFARALQRLGTVIMRQNLNNIEDLKIVRIFNEDAKKFMVKEIKKDQFKGNFDMQVEPDESLLINRDIFRKQLIDFYNLAAQDPQSRIKKEELFREAFKGGIKDINRFFMSDAEFNQKRSMMAEDSIAPGIGNALNGQNLPAPENGMTDIGMMQTINAQNIK